MQHGLRVAVFHKAALVQHGDAASQKLRQRQIVGHHELGDALCAAQLLQLPRRLQLYHRVQRAGRLVRQQDVLLQQQGQRHGGPLVHAAAQLIGAAGQYAAAVCQSQPVKGRRRVGGEPLLPEFSVTLQRVPELRPVGADGVEGRAGVLKDHAHPVAAEALPLPAAEGCQLTALQRDRSAGDVYGVVRAHQGFQQRAFAAAALAHHAQDLTLAEGEGDVPQHITPAVPGAQAADLQKRLHFRHFRSSTAA